MRDIYEFAKIPILVKYRGRYLGDCCKDYLTDKTPLFEVLATDEDLEYEIEHAEDDREYSKSYLEYIAVYRKFCEQSVYHNVILCHGSVLEYKNDAYLFTAPSGTGKSTHTALWRDYFGEEVIMINDDKPLLRFEDDGVYAYGTPWDGKHHISNNRCARLKGICFLKQGAENKIEKIDGNQALPMLMNQIYRPRQKEGVMKTLEYIDALMSSVPMYKMVCNMSMEAAKVAYEGMNS
jgi:hypothetical protein